MTFDHVFDEVIFDEVITLMETFDVVMVCKFFDVLFAFRCCDFRSSDLFPNYSKTSTTGKKHKILVRMLF